MLAGADLPHRKNAQHLAVDKRAANPKHRVSWPLRGHCPAFSPWGDTAGDIRPFNAPAVLSPRPRFAAPQRPRQHGREAPNALCRPLPLGSLPVNNRPLVSDALAQVRLERLPRQRREIQGLRAGLPFQRG